MIKNLIKKRNIDLIENFDFENVNYKKKGIRFKMISAIVFSINLRLLSHYIYHIMKITRKI